MFVVNEIYESQAGVDNHWKMAMESWKDFPALGEWGSKSKVTLLHGTPVIHSL